MMMIIIIIIITNVRNQKPISGSRLDGAVSYMSRGLNPSEGNKSSFSSSFGPALQPAKYQHFIGHLRSSARLQLVGS